MPTHYRGYVANINRIRLAGLINFYDLQSRMARARPSLVTNPLTGEFYGDDHGAPVALKAVIARPGNIAE